MQWQLAFGLWQVGKESRQQYLLQAPDPVQKSRFDLEKGLRQLNHHTGAIARLGISVQGPAMGEVA